MVNLPDSDPLIKGQILTIRAFNRFYTARLGLLRRRHLDSELSLTEARALHEIAADPNLTAANICELLELDAGYVSRLLGSLTKRSLVRQETSGQDRRVKLLTLSKDGQEVVTRRDSQAKAQVRLLLEELTAHERDALVTALRTVHALLAGKRIPPPRIERLASINPDIISLFEEYYEAVHVVQRDRPGDLVDVIRSRASGIWVAYQGDALVGCVMLRGLKSLPLSSECKRLYVRPSARGNRIADKILDAQETFARAEGLGWIYLDSYDDLKQAIALYERRGYERCARYNSNPQATLFMRKPIQ